jgi:ribonucleotide reductase class II
MEGAIGTTPVAERREVTEVTIEGNHVDHSGGRQPPGLGAVLPDHAGTVYDERFTGEVTVTMDLGMCARLGKS